MFVDCLPGNKSSDTGQGPWSRESRKIFKFLSFLRFGHFIIPAVFVQKETIMAAHRFPSPMFPVTPSPKEINAKGTKNMKIFSFVKYRFICVRIHFFIYSFNKHLIKGMLCAWTLLGAEYRNDQDSPFLNHSPARRLEWCLLNWGLGRLREF